MTFIRFMVFLLCLPFLSPAQGLEGGAFLGVSNYQGDLADQLIVLGETKLAFGLMARLNINPKLSIKGAVYNGYLSGHDANSKNQALIDRGYSFQSSIQEATVHCEWNILGRRMYNDVGLFVPYITPFISVGAGVAYCAGSPTKIRPNHQLVSFEEKGDKDVFFSLPVIFGIKYYYQEHINVGIEVGTRSIFSDYLDGVKKNGNPNKNDWYIFGGIAVTYVFGDGFLNYRL